MPKEGRKRAGGVMGLYGKENPVGVSLRGVVNGFGLLTVPGKGRENEEEGEKQAKPEIP